MTGELLGKRLVSLRKQHHLTQNELAEKMQVSRQLVSAWELGRSVPSKDKMEALCKLYGVSESELKDEEKEIGEEQSKGKPKSRTKIWEESDETRRLFLRIALAAVIVASVLMPFLGIIVCVYMFRMTRKWKVNHVWLDLLIFLCLLVDFYFVFGYLDHTIFDFGYGTVTPL